jgi:hypothetical protein
MTEIAERLKQDGVAADFAARFLAEYLTPAFGARSKSEIDFLVFECLIRAAVIDPRAPIYDTARLLNITPARVRGLLFNWQLRSTSAAADLRNELIEALQQTRFAKDGTLMSFGIESPLLGEEIRARLRRRGVFADASFSRELVRVPVDAFVEFLDDLVDDDTKTALKAILVKDKQLPDRSFKAVATGILMKLGEKVAGKAGEELAGELVKGAGEAVVKPAIERATAFLTSLLKHDATGAVGSLTADDLTDV